MVHCHHESVEQSVVRKLTTLNLPGINNSGPQHWQSEWEVRDATIVRVHQDEWDAPACSDWMIRLNEAVQQQSHGVVLSAHSSACALVAHWAASAHSDALTKVRGALLVAPSDPLGPHYPQGPTGFAPMPLEPLPFASIVVASSNDNYVTEAQARDYAAAWHSQFVLLSNAGHINSASNLGAWPQGLQLLNSLRSELI